MSSMNGLGAMLKLNQNLNANQFRILFFLCGKPNGENTFKADVEYLQKKCRLTSDVLECEVYALKFHRDIHLSYVRGMTSAYVLWEIEP